MKRRRFLAVAAGTGALAAAAPLASGAPEAGGVAGRLRSTAELPPVYQVPLPIPKVLRPVRSDAHTDYYEITQRVADLSILPGLTTKAWTYGGTFPGPTLVSRSGRRTVVTHHNLLPQPTVCHLHGAHTPWESDGYPIDLLLPDDGRASATTLSAAASAEIPGMPGMSFRDAGARIAHGRRTHIYPMHQRATTLYYHDHRMGFTGASVWRGMTGFHLVHDDEERRLPLPHGERDIPLMITDRAFTADGRFAYPALDPSGKIPGVAPRYMQGVLGDVILVNGAPWPVMETRRQRYRFRICNGSNSRHYCLELDPQPPGGGALVQIGGDGGLLERPLAHDRLVISPAERAEIVVDFARYRPGTQVCLINRFGAGRTAEVMRFDISHSSRAPRDDTHVPARLSEIEWLDPYRAVAERSFDFRRGRQGRWTVNGLDYEPGRAMARPRLGKTEVWRFRSDSHHSIHVHLNQFQVLTRNGGDPGPYDDGWKDTLRLPRGQWAEVLVRFRDYPGLYTVHCHNLEHEDMAMMADFAPH